MTENDGSFLRVLIYLQLTFSFEIGFTKADLSVGLKREIKN
jgi:hypothetical protein